MAKNCGFTRFNAFVIASICHDFPSPVGLMRCFCKRFLIYAPALVLSRQEDMRWTGKRHPYSARYALAADKQGSIQAYEVAFLQDGGAVADLSTAVLERTLFHATNAYEIPNAKIQATSCRTNHPSNTAFRGFGAPQAIYTLECAIDHLSRAMGKPRWQVQQQNLFKSGYRFSYGMTVKANSMRKCWKRLFDSKEMERRLEVIDRFNQRGGRQVKSLAFTPLCFGIAFTATHLNQASVTVKVYTDGSVGVSMSAVEMGQGVTEKVREVVARVFDIDLAFVSIDFTNSSKTANTSPTAASVGADLNGMAALRACQQIKHRLIQYYNLRHGESITELAEASISWQQLIADAYLDRIDLSSHAFYATPDLYFDRVKEQGNPFAYHVFGVSAVEVTLDYILGTYHVDTVDIVYDLGRSLNPRVDLGQMEGGVVQGVGYATLETIAWNSDGDLLTDSFATYKIPDLLMSPIIDVEFLESDNNPYGAFSAKAIGEPPFLLGLGAYFAIADAIRIANPQAKTDYQLPITPEKALLAMYG